MKLLKHLANLGYGSRREVAMMLRNGWVTDAEGNTLDEDSQVAHEDVRVDDEPLDPPPGMLLMLHKPPGYTCSTKDVGRLVYELLPERFRLRNPVLSSVGRLDRDTSGLLLMTDDGALLHRIASPKSHLPKVYEAMLASDLRGRGADLGCGYGFLAAEVLARHPQVGALDLYEADARALELARRNLDGSAAELEFSWHDVAAGLPRADYDFIVSNPPFHAGRADAPELGIAFIRAAAAAPRSGGRLFLDANRHLPYEATLAAAFAKVRVLADERGFKVFEATRA
jgi:predicted RNA methylase